MRALGLNVFFVVVVVYFYSKELEAVTLCIFLK